MGTRVTKYNVKDAKKDDKAHMSYLKQDINYDYKHGGSDKQMTNDEKHITNLARDVQYDDSVAKMKGSVIKLKTPNTNTNTNTNKNGKIFKNSFIRSSKHALPIGRY